MSVDAIAFTPDVSLFKNGRIIGLQEHMLGNIKNPFKFYSANIEKWSQEILDHWEEIENYTFVFYLQPIDSNYYCTFIHLSPASNGKVDESHFNKLYFKNEKLKNHHITILGNAFDADNKYDSLDCKAF